MIKDTFSALLSLFFPFPISTMRVPPQLELLTGKLDTVKGQRSGRLLGRPKLITATCMSVSSNQKQEMYLDKGKVLFVVDLDGDDRVLGRSVELAVDHRLVHKRHDFLLKNGKKRRN